jgi:hypothetical protein
VPARTCAICGSTVRVPDGFAGRTFECPECSSGIAAPRGSRRPKRDRTRPRAPSWGFIVLAFGLTVAATALLLAGIWLARRN